jgi:anti-sigma factor RsiW
MSCEQTRLYLHAYLDDELGVADAIRFEEHLADCAECQAARRQSLALRSALRRSDLSYQPSAALSARVNASLRKSAKPESRANWQWMALAATVIIASVLTLRTSPREAPLAREVVDSHIRSLQASHLVDVPSSDRHTVKPWFQGKLDFSPIVLDLAAQGWPLEGGRLDYIDGRPVAATVYERRKHQINVFVWPNSHDEPLRQENAQGYQLVHWTQGGMTYWIASDLNAAELLEFANLLRK